MKSEFFDLQPTADTTQFSWTPDSRLLTPANSLQGGAALGAALTAMEKVTGRPTIWATAQYLSFALHTEPIDIAVAVEVGGHNTSQARCVMSRDGREILTAHAAFGSRPMEHAGVWSVRPDVPGPDDCARYKFFETGRGHLGDLLEMRLALGRQLADLDGQHGSGTSAFWIRAGAGTRRVSAAELAFVGDLMPLGFADAIGHAFAGNSLDNTVRVGDLVDTEWVLLVCHIQQVVNGFGYGYGDLWAQDGTLLGQVSQSSVMRMHKHIKALGEQAPDA